MQTQLRVFGIKRLADVMGVPHVTVQSWLRPDRCVPIGRYDQIVRAMNAEIFRLKNARDEAEQLAARNHRNHEKSRASGG